jgi:hypothetical protein
MINALYLLRGGRHWDLEAGRPFFLNGNRYGRKAPQTIHRAAYFLIMVLGVFASEWTYAKMKIYTIDSRTGTLHQILQDISPHDAAQLSKRGWRYPEQVLHNWKEAKRLVGVRFAHRIRQRLELVNLLQMGTANARLLEGAGIDSMEKLGRQKADKLFPELVKVNKKLRLRNNPLLKRRVVAWIRAARRQSLIY